MIRRCFTDLIDIVDSMNNILGSRRYGLHGVVDLCHLSVDRIDHLHDAFELRADVMNRSCAYLYFRCAALHRSDGFGGIALDAGDALFDLLGGFTGLFSKLSYFLCDDCKAASGLSRACRFDGCIECKKVGLIGDTGDRVNNLADLLGAFAEFLDDFG